jgi:hypothetical protein
MSTAKTDFSCAVVPLHEVESVGYSGHNNMQWEWRVITDAFKRGRWFIPDELWSGEGGLHERFQYDISKQYERVLV